MDDNEGKMQNGAGFQPKPSSKAKGSSLLLDTKAQCVTHW